MIRRSTRRALAVAGCALMVVSGCSSGQGTPPPGEQPVASIEAPFAGAPQLPPPDLTDDGPGSLLAVEPIGASTDFDEVNAVAVRVVYRSTNAAGDPTVVSGVVAVPPGDPPPGGWPLLSFGHDLIGLQRECAPSTAENLGGYASIVSVLADRGYVVAMADYEGLGTDGVHPLLDARTLGRNMIDIVRAARHVTPAAGTRWAAFGLGQGGAAAWGANGEAAAYGGGLDLVGAVAVAPLADMSRLPEAMTSDTLIPAQYRLAILIVSSLALSPNSGVNAEDFISEEDRPLWGSLINCAVVDPLQIVAAAAQLRPSSLRPKTPEAADRLRGDLQRLALPGALEVAAPMLVIYATIDPVVPPDWIEQAVRTACSRGDPIEVKRIGDISVVNDVVLYDSVAWLQGRFGGQQPMNVCAGV